MRGKLEQYKIFKAVADKGNITAAARELYISQSAVSQSVNNLESSLSVKLFSRSKRGVSLTRDGEILYEFVAGALALIENGESRLEAKNHLYQGELTIGISNTLADCFLLPYLNKYHIKYPGIKVRIMNGTSRKVMTLLDSGRVDIAFATTNNKPDDYNSFLCFKTHTIFIASPDFPIDFDHVFTLKELSSLPLILLEREAGSRRFLEDCFLAEGLKLEPEIELDSYELLISLAGIGLGIAAITEEFSPHIFQDGALKKLLLSKELPVRAVSMVTPSQGILSAAAGEFVHLIKDEENTYE